MMDEKTMWLAGGGVALVVVLMATSGGSGATIINRNDPNAAESDRARADFASRGLESLASVANTDIAGGVSKYVAGAQIAIQRSRDIAYENVAAANADAQKVAARAASRGKSGFSIGIPGLGSFGIHW